MTSYRNYNDPGSYRPRSGASVGVSLARNSTSNTGLSSYRTGYSGGLSSARAPSSSSSSSTTTKTSSGYGAGFTRRDKVNDDKPTYKFTSAKTDTSRLNTGRTSAEDLRAKSPVSERSSSLYEKYSYNPNKTTTVLDKYNRGLTTRNKNTDIPQRYVASSYQGSGLRNYETRTIDNNKNERNDHSNTYKNTTQRNNNTSTSSRNSREPSPEVGTKGIRVYPRVTNYAKTGSTTEGTPIAPRYTTSSSRFTGSISRNPSERSCTNAGSYSGAERLHSSSSVKSLANYKEKVPSELTKEEQEKEIHFDNIDNDDDEIKNNENLNNTENINQIKNDKDNKENKIEEEEKNDEKIIVIVVTRGTSPGPPASSAFVRNRRADASRQIQRELIKYKNKIIETKDAEIQSDKIEDTTRYSRFSGTRVWPSYVDKYQSTSTYSRGYSPRISNFGYRQLDNNSTSKLTEPTTKISSVVNQQVTNDDNKNNNNNLNDTKDEKKKSIKKKDSITSSSSSESLQISNASKSVSRNGSSKSLNQQQRQMTRGDSSDSTVSLPTGKSKSTSSSSASLSSSVCGLSQGVKIKSNSASSAVTNSTLSSTKQSTNNSSSPSSASSVQTGNTRTTSCSPDTTRGKPPVPKNNINNNDSNINNNKTTNLTKYFHKDNRSKSLQNMNDKNKQKKYTKSLSPGSQESDKNNYDNNNNNNTIKTLKTTKTISKSPSLPRYVVLKNSRSNSISPRAIKNSLSSNSDSCDTSSSDSSSSDNNDDNTSDIHNNKICKKKKKKLNTSNSEIKRGCISGASSRTSILVSSADELSLTMDKPPRPPSNLRSRSDKSSTTATTKSEEAKAFLIRTLAPVTNQYKNNHDDYDNDNDYSDKKNSIKKTINNQKNISKSQSFTNSEMNSDKTKNGTLIHQSSGDRPWWLDSNSDNVPEGVEKVNICHDEISQETTVSINLPDDGKFRSRPWRQDSGERAWWLEQDDNNTTTNNELSVSPVIPRRNSSRSTTKSNEHKNNKLKHQQSGERAWWMSEDPSDVPEGIEVYSPVEILSPTTSLNNQNTFDDDNQRTTNSNRIRHVESGEKAWWMDNNSDIPEGIDIITHDIESNSNSDSSESYEKYDIHNTSNSQSIILSKFPIEFPPPPPPLPTTPTTTTTTLSDEPLGDRASPEGGENPPAPPEFYKGRSCSPYDNLQLLNCSLPSRKSSPRKRPSTLPLFIGNHTNIDDLLGNLSPLQSPVMSRIRNQEINDNSDESSECEEIDADQVIIHDSTPKTSVIQRCIRDIERPQPDGYIPLDDTALQLYKDGDYGAYLDLEASISEQQEEFEGFQTNRKNSIVLRTQLSVRVHTIIEKLLNSEGRELRRALFSLKQIFQEDKDLVHEFVQNDGLACLIKVGNEADQNYQNYILRALGQVMLYVDGMNGVMEHGQTVQWLYALIASRFRLVVKTALKLLLVFVEYVETNSLLLVRAVRSVDTSRGMIPWTNVMKLLKDYDAADTELLIYATTLINKCINGIPDQDTYYDQVDCLEEQGIEGIIQRYMSKQGTDLDLLRQFQIYEAVLHHEDGNDWGSPIRQLDDNIRKTLRNRKSLVDSQERRKSRRHSTGTSPLSMSLNSRLSPRLNHSIGLNSLNGTLNSSLPDDDDESSSSQSSQGLGDVQLNGSYKENKGGYPTDVGVTPALRRRRERAERQRSFIREQQEATANMRASIGNTDDSEGIVTNGLRYTNGTSYNDSSSNIICRVNSRKDLTPIINVANKLDSEDKKPWYGKSPDEGVECDEGNHTDEDEDRRVLVQMKREGTVKDLTQKLVAQNLIPSSPVEEKVSRIGDMSGLISKAKEGLAKSKSKADILKSPTGENIPKITEIKKSENELHWEELINKLKRPLSLCDLDFTDLNSDDEIDVLGPVNITNGIPPPPPPMVTQMNGTRVPPPPPPVGKFPPPYTNGTSQVFGVNLKSTRTSPINDTSGSIKTTPPTSPQLIPKKSKKTVKLFWKEVRDDPIILTRLDKNKMIWDELQPVPVDTQKLEHLFESRAKDLITKEKQQEMNKNKEIIVLDHKRSNAINIGMTKLPPPRSIKTAILKMDATIMNREGIEKLLTMLPTEEERSRIQEAQAASPDLPLGSAEQFLLTLASISELPARLKLWAFKLDFENSEKEIADPLMDLKQGMETLKMNKTFRGILSTLLSIGIFLNGNEVKGFQLEYLAKVPEVKDTVHKHSLLHHLCHMVMEKFSESTDLYSEIGAVTRASKIDFDELALNISKLESECKASWDHLKLIAKHDGSTMMKVKMSDFLADCAERIIVLGIVHRRIINRFHKFILWLGIPLHRVQDTKPNEFCRVVSEFALEYRTTRERVLQQLEKKANHRERNKTRGKMITESTVFSKVGKFRTKEDRADAELRQLLGSDISDVESKHGTLTWRRQRKDGRTSLGPILRDETVNGNVTDGDDELLESLVKTATKSPATRTTPRERKRTRHADRKSLKRSRTRENNTTSEGYRP
ncbi:uncharacterized protein LOC122860330 isoform X4 [Aphidius gifuensis]|uniref:uncharacterized protein LOC122860330 isoform X4 n=1 Tax=Aphidius gifuensis TaxID=684658 RepID=UPI001CDB57FE|nr:uncharacterized protein LOC122860330 isoform X4 [Aphidius gifuensis]